MKRVKAALLAIITLVMAFNPVAMLQASAADGEALNMIGVQTQNEGMLAVPAPGEVIVDGDFSDWDWSGRIEMFADIKFRDTYTNETAVMYDENYYYIGFKVKDPTPMENPLDPVTEGTWIWKKDCVQLRWITDKVMWMTFAYNHEQNRSMLLMDYWLSEDNDGSEIDSVIYYSDPFDTKLTNHRVIKLNPRIIDGIELAYKKDLYLPEYTIELKIPWEMVYTTKPTDLVGTTFRMGIEMYWGDNTNSTNHEYNYKDNMQPGATLRDFFWTGKEMWGNVTLNPTGNVEVRQYAQEQKPLTEGYYNIDIEVPKTAEEMSVVIRDHRGVAVRNLVSEMPVKDYIYEERADTNIVRVYWDGRDNWGKMMDPGMYTAEGLTHDGIKPIYDITYYNPGKTPWLTPDGTGAWGSDHVPPSSTAAIGDMNYYGWPQAEGGYATIAVDCEGNKIWGENRGSIMMAVNDKYLYSIPEGGFYLTTAGGDSYLMRLDRTNGDYKPFTLPDGTKRPFEITFSEMLGFKGNLLPSFTGLTANNEYVVMAFANDNKTEVGGDQLNFKAGLYVLDAESAILEKKILLPEVGQIAFAPNGMLYAIAGTDIYEVNVKSGKTRLIPLDVTDDFEMGEAIACDNDSNILVMDNGADMQIKAFNTNGKLVYTVGQKGGRPYVGKWEKEGLIDRVSAISVNGRDEINVVEEWNVPRRISVWGKDGKLIRDYIGNSGYSGTGCYLHEQDPNLAYYGPVEMKLDRETQSYEITRILYIPDASKGEPFNMTHSDFSAVHHFYSDASGERKNYVFQCPYAEKNPMILYMEQEDGTYKPVWSTGPVSAINSLQKSETCAINTDPSLTSAQFRPRAGSLPSYWQYIWNDYNDNGLVEDDECEYYKSTQYLYDFNAKAGWNANIDKGDLRFLTCSARGVYLFKPEYFRENGAPVYTMNSIKMYPIMLNYAGNSVNLIEGTNRFTSFPSTYPDADQGMNYVGGFTLLPTGTVRRDWAYKNEFPGVHGSHYALIPDTPGTVIGTIKNLGHVVVNGEGITMVKGNYGADYMFTDDGIYVGTLFNDTRQPLQRLPETVEEALGKDLSAMSEGSEPFGGILVQQDDGKIRLLTSLASQGALIAEIQGLETIKRFDPVKIYATPAEQANARAWTRPVKEDDKTEIKNEGIVIKRMTNAPTIDGELTDWVGTTATTVTGAGENASIRLAYDDTKLYAYFDVTDGSPMLNSGADFEKLFKTGDVCDIFLSPLSNTSAEAAEDDMRITISEMDGKPVVVLCKKIDKEADSSSFYNYNSPVGSVDFAVVKILDDAEVTITKSVAGYIVEAGIPLTSLGITITDDTTIRGDVGIVTSDEAGIKNSARICHYNKDTGLVSDLPGEANLYPDKWGMMTFKK